MLFFGMFLIETLCAVVPCIRLYDPPKPVEDLNNYQINSIEDQIYKSKVKYTDEDFLVQTLYGTLKGYPMKTIKSKEIFAFEGIPFAEKPIGRYRYRPPRRKRPWKGILEATKAGSHCVQIDGHQLLRITGSEDCLYMNIYTPKLPISTQKHPQLPVMLYIHGGSFIFGKGSAFGPAYLVDHNCILVTFNYRLSSLGFLTTGNGEGNWAMKDQSLAIKWVHDNIYFFGGDPMRITLFGQSAGAVAVHLHMMSNLSKGLFSSAISQSGSAFCYWAVRNESIDFSFRLAASLGCPINESRALIDCMRSKDPYLIAYHESILPTYKAYPGVFFGPIVETPGPYAFLEDTPENLYKSGKVAKIPWINGFLRNEGNPLAFLTYLYPNVIQNVDRRWSQLAPFILDFTGDIRQVSKGIWDIRKYYLGDEPITFYTRKGFSEMVGDRLIYTGVIRGLQMHSQIAPTFGYYFNYSGRYSVAQSVGLNVEDWGISHDDDMIYLMNSTAYYHSIAVGQPEYEVSDLLINLWTNFASTQKEPMYTMEDGEIYKFWDQMNDSNLDGMKILLINGDVPEMIELPTEIKDRYRFWDNLGLVSSGRINIKNFDFDNQFDVDRNENENTNSLYEDDYK